MRKLALALTLLTLSACTGGYGPITGRHYDYQPMLLIPSYGGGPVIMIPAQ